MPEDLDLFCLADPVHFAHPADWSPPWNVDLTRPEVQAGWSIELTSFWVVHRPPASELVGRPLTGWKIHLSAVEETATDLLEKVGEICVRERIVFKHLRSTALLVAMNSKGAPRTGSGKFVTIYPRDDAHSVRLADELSSALDGVAGPRVLTDVAWAHSLPDRSMHSNVSAPASPRVRLRRASGSSTLSSGRESCGCCRPEPNALPLSGRSGHTPPVRRRPVSSSGTTARDGVSTPTAACASMRPTTAARCRAVGDPGSRCSGRRAALLSSPVCHRRPRTPRS